MLDLRDEARGLEPWLPALESLYGDVRDTWRGRMVNETISAGVFEGLARQFRAAGLDESYASTCEEFAREERRHGVLCGAVVQAAPGEGGGR